MTRCADIRASGGLALAVARGAGIAPPAARPLIWGCSAGLTANDAPAGITAGPGGSLWHTGVNRDGVPDMIAGAGPGGGPHARVVSGTGRTETTGLFAYATTFTGGGLVAP